MGVGDIVCNLPGPIEFPLLVHSRRHAWYVLLGLVVLLAMQLDMQCCFCSRRWVRSGFRFIVLYDEVVVSGSLLASSIEDETSSSRV